MYIVIDTSYKCVLNNTNIKIQNGDLPITAGAICKQYCIIIFIYGDVTKTSEMGWANTI